MRGRAALVTFLGCTIACHSAPPPRDPTLHDDVAFLDARSALEDGREKPARGEPRQLQWLTDLDEGRRRSRNEGRPLFVWIRAEWSVEARLVEENEFSRPELSDVFERLVLVKVDVSASSEAEDASLASLGVQSVPAALLFDSRGQEIARLESPVDTGRLDAALNESVSTP